MFLKGIIFLVLNSDAFGSCSLISGKRLLASVPSCWVQGLHPGAVTKGFFAPLDIVYSRGV